jgi:hypothetical protein
MEKGRHVEEQVKTGSERDMRDTLIRWGNSVQEYFFQTRATEI